MKAAVTLNKRPKLNGNTTLLLITIVLFFVLYAAGCIAYSSKGFTNFQTFLNLLINNAGLLCVTCGMTCVMLTGGIDISVGSLVAMDCMLLAYGFQNWSLSAPVMCLMVLVIGVVFGLVQGFCVGYLNIQPFIVTMAGMFFARGMTAVISTNQLSITAETSQTFYDWANFRIYLPAFLGYTNKKGILQVPYIRVGVIVALAVLVIIFLVLRYTKFGRSLYAVGGSEQSAAMMGLDVKKTKMKAYVLSSFLCSIGGICYCLNTMAGSVGQTTGLAQDGQAVYYLLEFWPEWILAILASMPWKHWLQHKLERGGTLAKETLLWFPKATALCLLVVSYVELVTGSFNPFIYFQF